MKEIFFSCFNLGSDYDLDSKLISIIVDGVKHENSANHLQTLLQKGEVIVPLRDIETFVPLCYKAHIHPQSGGYLRNKKTGEFYQTFYL